MPPTLNATALSGDVNVVGDITLMPSATGTLNLLAEGSINGLQPAYHDTRIALSVLLPTYQSAQINLSDADPSKVSSVLSPITDIDPATGRTGSIYVQQWASQAIYQYGGAVC